MSVAKSDSFASLVKEELTTLNVSDPEMLAELSAIVRINGNMTFSSEGLRIEIQTENAKIARRMFNLVKNHYHFSPQLAARKRMKLKKNHVYVVRVNQRANDILEDLSILGDGGFNSFPSSYLVEDDETKRAYLRGCFLARGSVNDPATSSYHLELMVNDLDHAKFIRDLMNEYDLNAKVLERKRGCIIYLKKAEKIGDFLRLVGAFNGLFHFEDIRIIRDNRNTINRLNNSEQANVEKTMKAANAQIEAINLIKDELGFDVLDDKLRVVAEFRLKYDDVSLGELSEIISIETEESISKSGINHRMRKLKDMAKRIKEAHELEK
jgi:DNA-binding protein WhiA